MIAQPLVSILMTAYNRQQFIAEAIESVISLSYQNWELIIVDDCSKDDTVSIAKSYLLKDNRIQVFENKKNLGDYPNRNQAASYAQGEYLFYCDSDDQVYKDAVEKAVAMMEKYPDAGYGTYSPLRLTKELYLNSGDLIRRHFFDSPILMYGPGAMIIRNKFLRDINGFPEKYGPANDMYFHLKAAVNKHVVILPFELVNYRRHDGQEINNHFSYLANNYLYLKDALNDLNLPLSKVAKNYLLDKNKRRFIVNMIHYFIKTKDLKKVKEVLRKTQFTLHDFRNGIFHYYSKKPSA